MNQSTKFTVLFAFLLIFGFIIYPHWLLIESFNVRAIIFGFFVMYTTICLLILNYWFKKRLKNKKIKIPDIKIKDFLKRNVLLIISIFAAIISIIPAMNFPIMTLEDESHHIYRGIYMDTPFFQILNHFTSISPHILIWVGLLFLTTIIFLFRNKIKAIKFKRTYLFYPFLIIISLIYFLILNKFASNYLSNNFEYSKYYMEWLISYGSISALTSAMSFGLFGFNEVGVRVFSLIFYLLSSVFTYKLVNLYKNKTIALVAAILVLFFPCTFFYAHHALLSSGVMFFVTISLFYFMKYEKEKKFSDLLMSSFFVSLGFLYKRPVLIFFFIIWFYLGIKYLLTYKNLNPLKFIKKNLPYIKSNLISMVVIIPWFLIMNVWRRRKFSLHFTNWIDFEKATTYIRILPEQITIFGFILFVLAFLFIIYKIIKEKNNFYLLLISWVILYYFLFSSELFLGIYRYTNPMLPAVAMISICFLDEIFKKINVKLTIRNILYLILIISIAFTTLNMTYTNWGDRYLPMNEMFSYIKENVSEDARILRTMTPNPYNFYIGKYELPQYFEHNIWTNVENQTTDNLYEFCKSNNFNYVLFVSPQKAFLYYTELNTTWYEYNDPAGPDEPWIAVVNKDVVLKLENNEDERFELEKEFIKGRNKIMLFKII